MRDTFLFLNLGLPLKYCASTAAQFERPLHIVCRSLATWLCLLVPLIHFQFLYFTVPMPYLRAYLFSFSLFCTAFFHRRPVVTCSIKRMELDLLCVFFGRVCKIQHDKPIVWLDRVCMGFFRQICNWIENERERREIGTKRQREVAEMQPIW